MSPGKVLWEKWLVHFRPSMNGGAHSMKALGACGPGRGSTLLQGVEIRRWDFNDLSRLVRGGAWEAKLHAQTIQVHPAC